MREEEKSKYLFNIIISFIGMIIGLICLMYELFILKTNGLFWMIIIICNIIIFMGNLYGYNGDK